MKIMADPGPGGELYRLPIGQRRAIRTVRQVRALAYGGEAAGRIEAVPAPVALRQKMIHLMTAHGMQDAHAGAGGAGGLGRAADFAAARQALGNQRCFAFLDGRLGQRRDAQEVAWPGHRNSF